MAERDNLIEIDPALGVATSDRELWARQIGAAKKRAGRGVPAVDLDEAITAIQIQDTMEGSSTITLTVFDDEWKLIDQGFFDHDDDGKLDTVDVNYPDDSRFWWRMTQVGLNTSGEIVLTFMERAAVQLMAKKRSQKVSRAKRTRAEFIKSLTDQIGKGPGGYPSIRFHSRGLHTPQPIAGKTKDQKRQEKETQKSKGLVQGDDVTMLHATPRQYQIDAFNEAMDATADLNAPRDAYLGMICAGLAESPPGFNPHAENKSSHAHGVFQLLPSWWDKIGKEDTPAQARYFMTKGYTGAGSAIELAHKGHTPGEIAVMVEGSGVDPQFYGRWVGEAKKLLDAYGGAGLGSGREYSKQYNFTVGGRNNPNESYWEAIVRLAAEVKWAFFLDGQHAYYEDENVLIQQQPAAIIRRGDPEIVELRGTWDIRKIATDVELDLICNPFEFRAGQVFKLLDFGPLTTGSTARGSGVDPKTGLPGRWLISEIQTDRFSLFSTFTLKQPTHEKDEPRPETGTTKPGVAGEPADITSEMTPKQIIDDIVLPIANDVGIEVTPEAIEKRNAAHSKYTTTGGLSDHSGPSNIRWAADLFDGGTQVPTEKKDKLAKRLWEAFDMPPLPDMHSRDGSFQDSKKTTHGFDLQLIYRSKLGGNHYNHVHFGVHTSDGRPRHGDDSLSQPNVVHKPGYNAPPYSKP